MTMVSPSLKSLSLSDIQSLVELPSSIHNLNQLTDLSLKRCTNLKTIPTKINLEYLNVLNLNGCSGLETFPDISTNISKLYLNQTGIQEVPHWINKFSMLRLLHMVKCFKLKNVSLNICKLKHLEEADFTVLRVPSNKASWCDSPNAVSMEADKFHNFTLPVPEDASSSLCVPKLHLKFINCFILGQEALLQQISVLKGLIFPGEEMPSYFTHQTTGSSLRNIPLLHISLYQPFFRFRACAVVEFDPSLYQDSSYLVIQICCRFRERQGNIFEYFSQPNSFRPFYYQKRSHMFIFDCSLPLDKDSAQVTYDQVDIEFRIIEDRSIYILNGCGIRIFEDHCLSPDKQPDNLTSTVGQAKWALPHPTRRNILKDLTLALNDAKQQLLKGSLRSK